jgi:hypothetical protein
MGADSPNGSQEPTLGRARVPTANFSYSQHLSRGEQRQGSVGGARHGISQFGTGDWAVRSRSDAAPPRGSRASRERGSGDQGGSSGLGCKGDHSLPALLDVNRPWESISRRPEKSPSIPPSPGVAVCSRPRKDWRLSQGRTPSGAQRFPLRRPGRRGIPRGGYDMSRAKLRSPHSICKRTTSELFRKAEKGRYCCKSRQCPQRTQQEKSNSASHEATMRDSLTS